ncbi:hypothetical protein [Dyadobacter sp. NIV53]|uniref:hypothetical protein n=1 Tax=Dyadobacter sp. NIV53 TaxID=2861765 RepID=UPI001C8694C3|nr:hypothetical protein [Dyadobacter sp. NIV53]
MTVFLLSFSLTQYKITDSIPKNLKGKLPSIEELEKELEALTNEDKDPIQSKTY